ncbi:DUF6876 family protein [Formosa undariae]|uniref:DUF6876 family protein n=1 Tax=Formosa undariae TaxID=1325436 RepID=A0ABV5F103_9FLAO
MSTKVNILEEGLQQFHGSMECFKIPLINTRYTEGIQYLAEHGQCHWLITDASIIGKQLMKKAYFITIDFKRLSEADQKQKGYEAEIIYTDGNDTVLDMQTYRITDFPLQKIRLYFIDNMLMLPGEY